MRAKFSMLFMALIVASLVVVMTPAHTAKAASSCWSSNYQEWVPDGGTVTVRGTTYKCQDGRWHRQSTSPPSEGVVYDSVEIHHYYDDVADGPFTVRVYRSAHDRSGRVLVKTLDSYYMGTRFQVPLIKSHNCMDIYLSHADGTRLWAGNRYTDSCIGGGPTGHSLAAVK